MLKMPSLTSLLIGIRVFLVIIFVLVKPHHSVDLKHYMNTHEDRDDQTGKQTPLKMLGLFIYNK